MLDADWFWHQRIEDAIFGERVKNGCCGNCGAYDGPTHQCPPLPSWEK